MTEVKMNPSMPAASPSYGGAGKADAAGSGTFAILLRDGQGRDVQGGKAASGQENGTDRTADRTGSANRQGSVDRTGGKAQKPEAKAKTSEKAGVEDADSPEDAEALRGQSAQELEFLSLMAASQDLGMGMPRLDVQGILPEVPDAGDLAVQELSDAGSLLEMAGLAELVQAELSADVPERTADLTRPGPIFPQFLQENAGAGELTRAQDMPLERAAEQMPSLQDTAEDALMSRALAEAMAEWGGDAGSDSADVSEMPDFPDLGLLRQFAQLSTEERPLPRGIEEAGGRATPEAAVPQHMAQARPEENAAETSAQALEGLAGDRMPERGIGDAASGQNIALRGQEAPQEAKATQAGMPVVDLPAGKNARQDLRRLERAAEGRQEVLSKVEDAPTEDAVLKTARQSRKEEQPTGQEGREDGTQSSVLLSSLSGTQATATHVPVQEAGGFFQQMEGAVPLQTSEADLPADLMDLAAARMGRERQELVIELEPRSLGQITLRLHYDGNRASLSILAQNPKTLALLSSHAGEMARILEQKTGDQTVVYVPSQESGQQEQDLHDQQGGWSENQQEAERRWASQNEERQKRGHSESFLQQMRLGLV